MSWSRIYAVHKQERLFRRYFCNGAKLQRADLSSGESHYIGQAFILHRIANCVGT